MRNITTKKIELFRDYLINEEKAQATIKKYLHDIYKLQRWIGEQELSKSMILDYKAFLCKHYACTSVNSSLSSLNKFFNFMEWYDLRVKALKIQKQIFASTEKELKKSEYERLLYMAKQKKNKRLYLLMQTICSTGIRVSEVQYITVESAFRGVSEICCKGKHRIVFLPKQLCKMLKQYIKDQKIKSGSVFITKYGNPLDRSNIWSEMKKLSKEANVTVDKVFPHNLRHLFARTYYSLQKDIVRLADILGHTSVNTTRIYTMETGEIHRRQIQMLGLLRC